MFGEYAEGGLFAPYVTERRFVSSGLLGILEVAQPAGDFSDPPTDNLVLTQPLTRQRAHFDNGFRRFSGMTNADALTTFRPNFAPPVIIDDSHKLRFFVMPVSGLRALSPDPSERVIDGLTDHSVAIFRDATISAMCYRIWEEAGHNDTASRLLVEGAVLSLIGALLRIAEAPAPALVCGGLAPWQLRRAQTYMIEHLESEVGLAELAAIVGLSPNHFCTAFRQSTGRPPHAWLAAARMERAQGLLENPKLTLTEIAQTVGYTGQSAFGAAFRRATGRTPSAWRRERRR